MTLFSKEKIRVGGGDVIPYLVDRPSEARDRMLEAERRKRSRSTDASLSEAERREAFEDAELLACAAGVIKGFLDAKGESELSRLAGEVTMQMDAEDRRSRFNVRA